MYLYICVCVCACVLEYLFACVRAGAHVCLVSCLSGPCVGVRTYIRACMFVCMSG